MIHGRALHFVFKIADRENTMKFYREILGMKVLRHEEFTEGCAAACNGATKMCIWDLPKTEQDAIYKNDCGDNDYFGFGGVNTPYDNRWSKTMIGYGSEDDHFVIELTYNYNVHSYLLGNDFLGITIHSKEVIERARSAQIPISEKANNIFEIEAPGGYKYQLVNEPQPTDKDPVVKVSLASSNLSNSIHYWNEILGLKIFNQTQSSVVVGFADNQAKLELVDIGKPVDHAQAYGRIAFSCPYEEQPTISKLIEESKNKILTPLISLDTPGKATVRVIILADPDGHEICFVEDAGFRKLSTFDPNSEKQLDKYIQKDRERALKK